MMGNHGLDVMSGGSSLLDQISLIGRSCPMAKYTWNTRGGHEPRLSQKRHQERARGGGMIRRHLSECRIADEASIERNIPGLIGAMPQA
jgi:hypothetical protein